MVCVMAERCTLQIHMLKSNRSTSECDLIWRQGHCRYNLLRWGQTGVGWAPDPVWLCPRNRRKPRHKHPGRTPRDDEDMGQTVLWKPGDAKDCWQSTEARREPGADSPLSLRRNQPGPDPGFRPPEVWGKPFCCLSHKVYHAFFWQL